MNWWPGTDKIAGSDYGRTKCARRVQARDGLHLSTTDTRIFSPLLYLATTSPRYLARAFDMQKNPAGDQGAANFTGGIDSDCGSLLGRDCVDDHGLK